MRSNVYVLSALSALSALSTPLAAQVAIHPTTVEPASWERYALRVVNQQDLAVVRVRLEVPDALTVVGVESPGGWTGVVTVATDSTPQAITWDGAVLSQGGLREFAFMARLQGDARRKTLVFPVHLMRDDGSERRWGRGPGDAAPPTVQIRGSTGMTAWGAAALAGGAMGVAVLALFLALSRCAGAARGETGPGS